LDKVLKYQNEQVQMGDQDG